MIDMETKYCTHCNKLSKVDDICQACGNSDFQKIIISVQGNNNHEQKFPKID